MSELSNVAVCRCGVIRPVSPTRRASYSFVLAVWVLIFGLGMGTQAQAAKRTVARVQASWTQPITGQEIRLDPSDSRPAPGLSLVRYDWDFGDGRKASTSTPVVQHVSWALAAARTVKLTVTDSSGQARSTSLAIAVNSYAATGSLNDSGADWCTRYSSSTSTWTNGLNCDSLKWRGDQKWGSMQDGYFGRDARARQGKLNKVGSGAAGFDFTRIGADGLPLAVQDGEYSDTGNESDGTRWDCVRDNTTGLIWEVKRNDPEHLRHAGHRYGWYSTDGTNNGGYAGYEKNSDTLDPETRLPASCTGVADTTKCNTQSYATAVNGLPAGQALCGFRDWRLPTLDELGDLPLFGRVDRAIDTDHFPYSSKYVWSASTYMDEPFYAWVVNFQFGIRDFSAKNSAMQVALVRSGQ